MSQIVWSSPSGIKSYLECPRRGASRGPASPQMMAGTVRHAILEAYYRGADLDLTEPVVVRSQGQLVKEWALLDEPTREGIMSDIVAAAERPGFLPDRESVISCEGSGLPKDLTVTMYDSTLLAVHLTADIGLRMRMDLVCWSDEEPGVVRIPDFKGRSEDDWSLTGMCYAYGVKAAFDQHGFTHARFEPLYLGSCRREAYEYELSEAKCAEYRDTLLAILMRMRADTERAPTLNKWCRYCHLQSDCPAYAQAVTTPAPVATAEAVAEYQLPAETGDLIDLRERLKLGESILEHLKERVNDDLRARLASSPFHHAGRIWDVRERTTRWDVDSAKALVLADSLGIPIEPLVSVNHTAMKPRIEAHLSKMKREGETADAIQAVQAAWDDCRKARTAQVIQGRAEKVAKRIEESE